MKQEDKQLLLQDLCARLPYGVICNCVDPKFSGSVDWTLFKINLQDDTIETTNNEWNDEFAIENIKPYLRPMSSMTEEEIEQIHEIQSKWYDKAIELQLKSLDGEKVEDLDLKSIEFEIKASVEVSNFCYKNHFDYRGLIEKGLAIEAPEGMYYE